MNMHRERPTPDHELDFITIIGRYDAARRDEDETAKKRLGKAMNRHIIERSQRMMAEYTLMASVDPTTGV